MLELREVSYAYPRSDKPAAHGASLAVSPGECVAVVGLNGSGKSTLALLASGSLAPSEGVALCDGYDPSEAWEMVGLVRQDPEAQLLSEVVSDEVAFGPNNLGLSDDEVTERVMAALEACRISHLINARVSELSGGEKQRLALAGVLACDPRYLVLDEPTSQLDSTARAVFQAVLAEQLSQGKGVLLVTHRKEEVLASNRVVLVENGTVTWEGTPNEFASTKAIAYTDIGAMSNGPDSAVPIDTGGTPLNPGPSAIADSTPAETPQDTQDGPALHVKHISVLRNEVQALSDVSYVAKPGRLTLISGRSGSGKSTFALTASGLMRPTTGSVTLGDAKVRVGDVGLCQQRPEDQLYCDTVLEDVALAPHNIGLSDEEAQSVAKECLKELEVSPELWQRRPWELSGGEKRRVAIAGIMAAGPVAYVFDEPTAGLDVVGSRLVRKLALRLARSGKAVIVMSHDVEEWLEVADDVMFLKEGKLVYEGSSQDVAGSTRPYELADLVPPMREGMQPVEIPEETQTAERRTPRKSLLYRVPAIIKMIVAFAATLSLLLVDSEAWIVALCLIMLALLLSLGVRPKSLLDTLRSLTVVFALTLAAHVIRLDGTAEMPIIGFLGLSPSSLMNAVFTMLRILTMVFIALAYARTTTATQTADAFMAPFYALGIKREKVYSTNLAIMLTLRSIPYSVEVFHRLENAQLIRRTPLHNGPIIRRLQCWASVLISAVVVIMRHGDELGDAMRERGIEAPHTQGSEPPRDQTSEAPRVQASATHHTQGPDNDMGE